MQHRWLDRRLAFIRIGLASSLHRGLSNHRGNLARGMGVVFKAEHKKLNRMVALKLILSRQFASDRAVQRFYTEAEAVANLDHPGIVSIYEIGNCAGYHYFSMSYIEGGTLADAFERGVFTPDRAAQILVQLCNAMHHAHQSGVIHRDLKPENVLITRSGEPKIVDFGLAKKTTADHHLTETGHILGTPNYMSPEQAAGNCDGVGPLTDVYSLGAILYFLLTGRAPFRAATRMEAIRKVVEEAPELPRSCNRGVPVDLETICLKCLNKNAHRRYRSARALAADLERYLAGEPIHARRIGYTEKAWQWGKRRVGVVVTSACLASVLPVLGLIANHLAKSPSEALIKAASRESVDTFMATLEEHKNAITRIRKRVIRAQQCKADGDYAEARRLYKSAIQDIRSVADDPFAPVTTIVLNDAFVVSAMSVHQKLADLEKAANNPAAEREALRSAIDLAKPRSESLTASEWEVLGQLSYRLQRWEETEHAFANSINLRGEGTSPTADNTRWWYRSIALAQLGRRQQAERN